MSTRVTLPYNKMLFGMFLNYPRIFQILTTYTLGQIDLQKQCTSNKCFGFLATFYYQSLCHLPSTTYPENTVASG